MAIVVLVLLAFMPALTAGYVDWDDTELLLENTRYRALSPSNLRWMFSTSFAGHFQPLTWLSYTFDYAWMGDDPFGFHVTNVVLHAAAAIAFYFVVRRLFDLALGQAGAIRSTPLVWSAAFATLVFAVHPLRVESVAWLAQRRDVLSGFLYILSVGAYLRFAGWRGDGRLKCRSPAGAARGSRHTSRTVFRKFHDYLSRRLQPARVREGSQESGQFVTSRGLKPAARVSPFYVAALVFCLLSLLAKAVAVTLPLVLLILDVYPLRRLGRHGDLTNNKAGRVWLEKLPFLLLALPIGIRALVAQERGGALSTYGAHDLWARLAQACHGLTFYLWKTIWPVHLGPLYQMPPRDVLLGPGLWISLAAIVFIAVGVVGIRRRLPAVPTALAAYVVIVSPVLGFAQSGRQLVADRYSYLSCLGLAVLAGGALLRALTHAARRANSPRPALLALAAVAVVTALAHATFRQNNIWQSPLTLWEHGVRVSPKSSIAHANYADALAKAGGFERAVPHYQRALELDPRDAIAAAHLGRVYEELRALPAAAAMYQRALRLDPNRAHTHLHLAQCLMKQWRFEAALTLLRSRAHNAPHDLQAISYLAQLLASHSSADVRNGPEAVRWASLVSKAHGDTNALALLTLATALAEASRFEDAIAAATRAHGIAARTGDARLAAELTRRLMLFQAGKPYHFRE